MIPIPKIVSLTWRAILLIGLSLFVSKMVFGQVLGQKPEKNIYSLMEFDELEKVIAEQEEILKKEPSGITTLKILGIAYHNLSVIGKKGVSKKAFSILAKAYESKSDDYEILAYLGSTKTLLGRDAFVPFNKLYYVYEGCQLMDKAVSKAPDNFVVRLCRANNSLALPSFFRRAKYVKKDMFYLLKMGREKKFSPELLATIYCLLGEYYKVEERWELASDYWEKAVKIAPNSKDGMLSKKRLEVYKP
ncbi:hypothetical protein KKD87_03000 [bacterium]|nr:hypothetical protein [bacterium]MBU2600079.1 hypothetical protein [bacterium]